MAEPQDRPSDTGDGGQQPPSEPPAEERAARRRSWSIAVDDEAAAEPSSPQEERAARGAADAPAATSTAAAPQAEPPAGAGRDADAGDAAATGDAATGDGAAVAAGGDAGEDAGTPRLSPLRRVLGDARIAWLVAGIALLALIGLAIAAVPALNAEQERAEVRDRAEVIAARVTTFEGEDIEEWVAETRALATGDYAEQLDDVFDQELRDALRENEVESVGTIQRSFVQALEGDRAEVFVLARQVSRNAQRDQPVEDELRIEIELRREDGEWLASDIAVLGPQQGGPVPAPEGVDVDADADE